MGERATIHQVETPRTRESLAADLKNQGFAAEAYHAGMDNADKVRNQEAFLKDEVKIMVGGAPVTQEFADDMGADGYGKDALACVALAKSLLGVEVKS